MSSESNCHRLSHEVTTATYCSRSLPLDSRVRLSPYLRHMIRLLSLPENSWWCSCRLMQTYIQDKSSRAFASAYMHPPPVNIAGCCCTTSFSRVRAVPVVSYMSRHGAANYTLRNSRVVRKSRRILSRRQSELSRNCF